MFKFIIVVNEIFSVMMSSNNNFMLGFMIVLFNLNGDF